MCIEKEDFWVNFRDFIFLGIFGFGGLFFKVFFLLFLGMLKSSF